MATQKAEYIWGLGKSLPNLSLVGEMERGEGALQQMPLLALGKNCFSHYHSLSQSLEDSEVGLEKKKEMKPLHNGAIQILERMLSN